MATLISAARERQADASDAATDSTPDVSVSKETAKERAERHVDWVAMGVQSDLDAVLAPEQRRAADRATLKEKLVRSNGHFLTRIPEDSPAWELLDTALLEEVLREGSMKQQVPRRVMDYILSDRDQVVAVAASPQELAVDRVTKHLERKDAETPVFRDAHAALRSIPTLAEETAEEARQREHLRTQGVTDA